MPFNSSGIYSLPPGSLGVTGQTILAQTHNRPVQDIEQALSVPYLRDGRAPMIGNIPMNGYQAKNAKDATDPQDFVTLAQMQAAISAVTGVPVGVLLPYTVSSTVIPVGYLVANGLPALRASYPVLWAAVQAGGNLAATQAAKTHGQYGPGDGSTTFTLPNLYADDGYFIRPMSSTRTIGSLQIDDFKTHAHTASFSGSPIPDHTHTVPGSSGGGAGGSLSTSGGALSPVGTSPAGAHTPAGSVSINPSGGAETRPKNIAYPVLIKAL